MAIVNHLDPGSKTFHGTGEPLVFFYDWLGFDVKRLALGAPIVPKNISICGSLIHMYIYDLVFQRLQIASIVICPKI